eukprot:UN22567
MRFSIALLLVCASATIDFPYFFTATEPPASTADHDKVVDFDQRDILTFSIASVLIMIAAGGGIGGGGVLVPTYIFVLGFAPQYAIPLSNATILGSSIANLLFNARKRHPEADRPLIDWDIMLVMEPVTIAGALVGSFINVLSPPWLICILLVILLTATAVKSYKKGIKMYKKETEQMEAAMLNSEPGEVFKQKLVNVGYSNLDMENPMDMAMQEKTTRFTKFYSPNNLHPFGKFS